MLLPDGVSGQYIAASPARLAHRSPRGVVWPPHPAAQAAERLRSGATASYYSTTLAPRVNTLQSNQNQCLNS